MSLIFHSITIFFIESAQPRLAGRILDFRQLSCSDGSGKYQNKEKPLKRQRNLGLICMLTQVYELLITHLHILVLI